MGRDALSLQHIMCSCAVCLTLKMKALPSVESLRLLAQRHGVASHITRMFSNTAVRTSHCASCFKCHRYLFGSCSSLVHRKQRRTLRFWRGSLTCVHFISRFAGNTTERYCKLNVAVVKFVTACARN